MTTQQCPECGSDNPQPSFFCNQCGAILYKEAAHKKNNAFIYITFAVACLLLLTTWYALQLPDQFPKAENALNGRKESRNSSMDHFSQTTRMTSQKNDSVSAQQTAPALTLQEQNETSRENTSQDSAKEIPLTLTTGMVTVLNPWQRIVTKIPAAIVSGGWTALPARTILGGNHFVLGYDTAQEYFFEGGLWLPGDAVGLWRLQSNISLESPELNAWNKELPLYWLSLQSGKMYEATGISPYIDDGYFSQCLLPQWMSDFGLFVQGNKIVGWTFTPLLANGFLWNGNLQKVQEYESGPDDFYQDTFAGGREEQFSRALAMDDKNVIDRIQALADGFRKPPKLAEEETPESLRTVNMLLFLDILVSQAMYQEQFQELVNIVDPELLKTLASPQLLLKMMTAAIKTDGYAAALKLAADVRPVLVGGDTDQKKQLNNMVAECYWRLIYEHLDQNELTAASNTFTQAQTLFPDNAEIHLAGVQLALADLNWQEAERLLYSREYPPTLSDLVQLLESRISELKSQEGKIVIRFPPNTRQIPVTGLLDGIYEQRFVIDTGAAMVTIPSSAVSALGASIESFDPVHNVTTAGGDIAAYEIVLGSLALGNWAVNNINVLVMDIPGQPDVGLLGLNFLNHFRMELDSEKGVLLLTPQ